MDKLKEYRQEIEKVDEQLIKLISQRMELSKKIGEYKKENNLPIFDPSREEELKNKNILLVKEEYREAYKEVFETILKVSKNVQL